jgi:hypothetical protein
VIVVEAFVSVIERPLAEPGRWSHERLVPPLLLVPLRRTQILPTSRWAVHRSDGAW